LHRTAAKIEDLAVKEKRTRREKRTRGWQNPGEDEGIGSGKIPSDPCSKSWDAMLGKTDGFGKGHPLKEEAKRVRGRDEPKSQAASGTG